MNILLTRGIQEAMKWDQSLETLLEDEDPVETIVKGSTYNPITAEHDLRRIARGASEIALRELGRRKQHKEPRDTDLESLSTACLRLELTLLLAKINEARRSLDTPTHRLGYIGAEVNGRWMEIKHLDTALEIYRDSQREI